MGISTYFFAASQTELADTFAGWHIVSDHAERVQSTNPFTGEPVEMVEWQPAELIAEGDGEAYQKIPKLVHVVMSGVDHVKLATLHGVLCGVEFDDSIACIARPALLRPEDCESGLHQLPSGFVAALAGLSAGASSSAAQQWCATDEMQADRWTPSDCEGVLEMLSNVAQAAQGDGFQMYFYWHL